MTNFDLAKKQTEELSRAFHNGVKQGHTQAIKKVQEKIAKLKCGLEDYDEALTDLNDILVEEAKLSEGAK